jgi:hypothetical protein
MKFKTIIATHVLVSSLYLPRVGNFIVFSFGHLTSACSTPVFYKDTVEGILTGNLAAHRTLTYSTHADNIACWVTCWSLSLLSVQCSLCSLSLLSVWCSLWSLSLCIVQCSLWSLSLWSVQYSLWSLSLCSLPSLCSGSERPQSSYSVTWKRFSSQSLLPFQLSTVPKILQWMCTAIKPQPSWHHRCYILSPNNRKIFAGTALTSLVPLQTC